MGRPRQWRRSGTSRCSPSSSGHSKPTGHRASRGVRGSSLTVTAAPANHEPPRACLAPRFPPCQAARPHLVSDAPYQYWVKHFRKVKQYLKRGGVAMIQTMLCNRSIRRTGTLNFFSKCIFPAVSFPRSERSSPPLRRCEEQLAFGSDYARTMDEYWKRFHRNLGDVKRLGYDDQFIRRWDFFLAGWYAMFKSGHYNDMQAKLAHCPQWERPAVHPLPTGPPRIHREIHPPVRCLPAESDIARHFLLSAPP
jgi:Mycolic acid cyclopropane synthetase